MGRIRISNRMSKRRAVRTTEAIRRKRGSPYAAQMKRVGKNSYQVTRYD